MKAKRKQRVSARQPEPLVVPKRMGQCRSMDFMSDRLDNNGQFRTSSVIDGCNRELLGIDIGTGLPSARVTRYLDELVYWHVYQRKVRVDNGSDFTCAEFVQWAYQHGVYICDTQPGCPDLNTYIERFNRTYRQEVVDLSLFTSLKDAQNMFLYLMFIKPK